MRRLLSLIVIVPFALVLILLAIANRGPVTFSLDPFGAPSPAMSVSAPLFVFILASAIIGVVFGGVAVWLGQGQHRRLERQYRRDAERFKLEGERLKAALPPLTGAQG
jgi:uncharacterized integral membrane protein